MLDDTGSDSGTTCEPPEVELESMWVAADDDARVRTVIPIDHHAGGPTFTVCDVPASDGSYHADADMLEPLAVITCLEFQAGDVAHTAALHTELGCVDVRVGVQTPAEVQWPCPLSARASGSFASHRRRSRSYRHRWSGR